MLIELAYLFIHSAYRLIDVVDYVSRNARNVCTVGLVLINS